MCLSFSFGRKDNVLLSFSFCMRENPIFQSSWGDLIPLIFFSLQGETFGLHFTPPNEVVMELKEEA